MAMVTEVRSAFHVLGAAMTFAVAASAVGCAPSYEDPPYLFSEHEMRYVSEGAWVGTLKSAESETSVALELSHAPSTQVACGSRTLGAGALTTACMGPSTNMAFTGTLTTGDGQFDRAPVTAYFTMWGSIIANGDLMLTVDGERATATIPFRSGGFAEGSLQIGKASATLVLYRP